MNRRSFFTALTALPGAVLALGRQRPRRMPITPSVELNNHGPMFMSEFERHHAAASPLTPEEMAEVERFFRSVGGKPFRW